MPKPAFSPTKLKALLDERGLTATSADVLCGWVRTTGRQKGGATGAVLHWLSGRTQPDPARLFMLAAKLGVPVEALYEDENNPENNSGGT